MTACQICGVPADGYLCSRADRDDPGHIEQLEQAVAELPAYLDELDVVVAKQAAVYRRNGPAGGHGDRDEVAEEQRAIPAWLRSPHGDSAMRATTTPANLDAADLRRDTIDELLRMACLAGADEISSRRVCAWLLNHLADIRLSADAGEIYDRITSRRRQLERAVDRAPSRIWAGPCDATVTDVHTEERDGTVYSTTFTAKCPRDLYAWPGADEITCDGWTPRSGPGTGCGTVHTADSRHDWLIRSTDDALLPMDTWRESLPRMLPFLQWPDRSTWWRWAQRLENRGRPDAPLYRGGDIVAICEQQQNTIIANRAKRRRTA